jgi:hypothetical protein
MAAKRRSGRFSLEENRQLMSMASNGATVEAAAARFGALPETIGRKVAKLGIQLKVRRGRNGSVRRVRLCWPATRQWRLRSREPRATEEDNQLRASVAEGQTVRPFARHSKRTTRAIRRRAEILELSWLGAKAK